jgi:hypothetical protein
MGCHNTVAAAEAHQSRDAAAHADDYQGAATAGTRGRKLHPPRSSGFSPAGAARPPDPNWPLWAVARRFILQKPKRRFTVKYMFLYDPVTRGSDGDTRAARLEQRIARYRRALRRCAERLRRERAAREAADKASARWRQASLIFARRDRLGSILPRGRSSGTAARGRT